MQPSLRKSPLKLRCFAKEDKSVYVENCVNKEVYYYYYRFINNSI